MKRKHLSKAEFLARMAAGRAAKASRGAPTAQAKGKPYCNHNLDVSPSGKFACCTKCGTSFRNRDGMWQVHPAYQAGWDAMDRRIKSNPPARKRTRASSPADSAASAVVIALGDLLEVKYRHAATGEYMVHKFKRGQQLCFFRDRRNLAIPGVRIVERNGHPYIGD